VDGSGTPDPDHLAEADEGMAVGDPTAAADRRCPECGMKLSLYNPGPHCWQHTMGWPWRGPSAKPRF